MDDPIVSLLAAIALLVVFDLAAARWGADSRQPGDARRDREGPVSSIR